MQRHYKSQPIHLRTFDWAEPDDFKKQLEEQWLFNSEDYIVLECLARQAFMRWAKNPFAHEPVDETLAIGNFKTCDAYLSAIKNFIKEVETKKREGFQRVLDLTDARNSRENNGFEFYKKFGPIDNDPIVLMDRKNEDGSYAKPTVFLGYGMEKAVCVSIFKELEDVQKLEDDIAQYAEEDRWSGGKSKIKGRHVKEYKKHFGEDGKERGRYLEKPNVKDGKIEFSLRPSEHQFFKEFIAAYHAVFHSYFELDNGNQNSRFFRDNFDNFLASKLKYMFGEDSERLKRIGYDIDPLFVRKTIKDRIKGNPFNDTRKFQVFGSSDSDNIGLLKLEFLEFLEKRNQTRRNTRMNYQE